MKNDNFFFTFFKDPVPSNSESKEMYVNNAGSTYFSQGDDPEKVRVTA